MESSTSMARRIATLEGMGFQRADASPIPTESAPVAGNRHKLTVTRPSMGTLVSVTVNHASRNLMDEALGKALEEMDRVVELLNRYDPASAVSVLNAQGGIQGPPPELSAVLEAALRQNRISHGAFDPTVQPLVDLFRERRRGGSSDGTPGPPPPGASAMGSPSNREVLALLDLVDPGAVALAPRSISFRKEGMGVTLDGIAKGYVVDRVATVLLGHGLADFLINAGGDIRSAGFREDGRPWQVAIQDPRKTGAFPDIIPLSGAAVATSGSYEIYFDPEGSRHHIVDSGSGLSPQMNSSVSVAAPTTMDADALATSVFLMDPEKGAAFIDSLPGCACLIVDRHGRQVRSARWRSAREPPTSKAGIL
jgi:thiamine biosynthesis lipoprotein